MSDEPSGCALHGQLDCNECLYSAVLRAKRDRDEELASLRDRVAELERDLTVEREQVESWKRALGQLVEARNFFRDELDCARSAMREAVRDFHCKSVLFSASFLRISGDVETKG